ncbi:MAG: hypothetical protein EA401_04590 [Planctomycetota bacterium]|nr:MAG: hypothetical protein EA401_04590 [Planctomycetota bacterium]
MVPQGGAKLGPEAADLLIGQQKTPLMGAFCTKSVPREAGIPCLWRALSGPSHGTALELPDELHARMCGG